MPTTKSTSYQFRFVESQPDNTDDKLEADMDIAAFLRKPCASDDTDFFQFKEHPFIQGLFKKFNAICTSSAPVERLFSYAGTYKKFNYKLFHFLTFLFDFHRFNTGTKATEYE